ncbi:MAG: cytochrome b [Candidatus Fonsibacter sp.]|jgi:ubiquinol-cytochrome c reductase cytochrome b subunit|uniref:cytochrome b n=1 Tax=Candidatus Fonsibacter ubiquis TaxID=1925548 RepID=UPI000C089A58|nr:cytochrome b/b6 [Candidatus Fonsibacter ubiquis]NCW70584.1 cytochrome b/b6 [Pseudomonadota bacterium]GBL34318.1 cytochrome b [Pelagibacterales bacterium]NCU44827.1 cytochrome b/b6 [Candidatus Fonsibacter ubiquis]NCU45810.1 cytochrome b/b6 [Candidatus Fonsibacter ubiquis]NCU47532.1 cytochrome b/b6 [Candidatus Fonsibacter ubiquis]
MSDKNLENTNAEYKPVHTNKVGGSPFKGVVGWIDNRLPIFRMFKYEYLDFQVPKNLSYLWSLGGILMICLIFLIVTGLVLGMHYKPSSSEAFESVEKIMRDVNFGWLIRYMHMNFASFFFIAVYIHIFRGLYYGSYKEPRQLMWLIGIVIFFLMMATAFLGYTLPWGQMSYWGATVITNLFSAVPFVGESIVTWLWGDYAVGDATLNRFYVLHWLIAFGILGIVIFHVIALHIVGSNNPSGIEPKDTRDTVSFAPFTTSKDLFAMLIFLFAFVIITMYAPNYLGHPDNYIPADPLVTPAHIVPEWYFLPFYAILRSIPDKLMGVIAMVSSIAILGLLPWLDLSKIRSSVFRPIWKQFVFLFVLDFFILMYVGGMPAEGIYLLIGRVGTAYWFLFFLIIAPLVSLIEKPLPMPNSIHEFEQWKKQGKIKTFKLF